MFQIILIVLVFVLVYFQLTKHYSYWTNIGVKQRNQIYLLGDNASVILRRESFFEMVQNIYNCFPNERFVGIYQGLKPTLMLKDLELIKNIAIRDFDYFTDHYHPAPDAVDRIWTKNLLGLKGNEWREMRATLSPSFTLAKVKIMFNIISETAGIYFEYLKARNHTEAIELKDFFTRYTNDVIATAAFGIKCDSINNKTNKFYRMGKEATTFSLKRYLIIFAFILMPKIAKCIGLKIFSDDVTNFFKETISTTIKTRKEQLIVRPDMLHLLMEARKNGVPLSDIDITSQAVIFFFGGFETVSNLLCFMGYELALNPDIQQKLQKEIDITIKECTGGNLTYEVLTKMKYLDMVISETLRKWPMTASDRICTKSYKIETSSNEKEILLQPGDIIWIPIGAIHRDPKYYPNPEKFDPERFSEVNRDTIESYTFLPFSIGPRNCIGSRLALLEAKIIFFYILQYFNLVPNDKTEVPLKISKNSFNLVSENGMRITLKPRIN